MLDFAVDEASFGKPSGGADLRLGLATAPTLYAWEEFEEMGPLIERRFEREGDVELVRLFFLAPLDNRLSLPVLPAHRIIRLANIERQARSIVAQSKAVKRTRELAEAYAAKAREVLELLPDSDAKEALAVMTEKVVKRKH